MFKTWLNKLEQLAGGGPGGGKRIVSFRILLLLGLVGIGLMLLQSFLAIQVKQPDAPVSPLQSGPGSALAASGSGMQEDNETALFRKYEEAYERELKAILEKIVGVSHVEVMVTVESTEEITVEKNSQDNQQVTSEKDTSGATRHITDINRNTNTVMMQKGGEEKPLVIKTTKPKIRGVVVVARGAENLTVKQMIVEAVERGLDVPAHKISVVPHKQS